MTEAGVTATKPQILTVTVPAAETNASHVIPVPGSLDGDTLTDIAGVEFVTATVPVVQVPAVNNDPPIAAVVADKFGLMTTPETVKAGPLVGVAILSPPVAGIVTLLIAFVENIKGALFC